MGTESGMISRWRMLRQPDVEHDILHPEPREALGLWILGTLWILGILGFVLRGERGLVPILLAAGLLAIWGWRSDIWLPAFPAAALLALAADTVGSPNGESAAYLELLVAGFAVVAIARFVGNPEARSQRAMAAMSSRMIPLPVAAGVVAALALSPGHMTAWARLGTIGLALFFASRAAALPLGGRRWAWTVFSLATVWLGMWGLLSLIPALAGELARTGATLLPLVALTTGLATGLARSRGDGSPPL